MEELPMKELLNLLKHDEYQSLFQINNKDHREEFQEINKEKEFFSIILLQEPIHESMFDNPKYVKKIPVTHKSLVEQEAWNLMSDDYHRNYDWIHDEVAKHYNELENKEKFKEFDYYLQCLLSSYYPQALEECLWDWAMFKWFDNNDSEAEFEEEQYNEIISQHEEEFEKYKKEVFLPQYKFDYELIYENYIPKPLCYFLGRSLRSQFYIIREDNSKLSIAMGSSIGSGTRETHGFYGHLFAEIQKKIKPIKTFVAIVDNKCNFKIKKKSENLILLRHDLTGNYKINHDISKQILDGISMTQ